MTGTPDRGVGRDIYSRNYAKALGDTTRLGDQRKVLDAIELALEKGAKNKMFLGSLKRSARRSGILTSKQLNALNAILVKIGATKISVEVHDAAKKKRRWEAFTKDVNERHEAMVASLPKKPPARRTHDSE